MDEAEKKETGKNTAMAVVAYILFFVPLLTDAKDDPFVKYHVKQGLVLFLTAIVLGFISLIPFIFLFSWILYIGLFILFIIGVLNAINGKQKPLPLIGQFADKFKF